MAHTLSRTAHVKLMAASAAYLIKSNVENVENNNWQDKTDETEFKARDM